jgi:peptidoglycan/xylan/chitin deacetylase (PgdA/CDA1 family)
MESLLGWGYTVIPLSTLVEALIHGADLPERPVVITFDDGDLDVYENAFPIMRELGMVGTFFIVSNRLKGEEMVNAEQLGEMVASGWEIGSHSQSHADLTADHNVLRDEILQSRLDLQDALSVTVTTFAYPFGQMDSKVAKKVSEFGYTAAVGLGKKWTHTWGTLFYLNRIEIHGDFSLEDFAARLPWNGEEE